MNTYVILIRGINVGGKNRVPMADLKKYLEEIGFTNVVTYIASGNVILDSDKQPAEVKKIIEDMLLQNFASDSQLIKVLVLTHKQIKSAVDAKPKGFGEEPGKYHTDIVFLIDIDATQAMTVFSPRQGVDKVWKGDGVVYSQRLSAERTKSRLAKIVGTPEYKSMTIRTFNTTAKLLEILESRS